MGKDLLGRFARWRKGSRAALTFEQKVVVLKLIKKYLNDDYLSWSIYWLESGSEPASVRGMNAKHIDVGPQFSPVLITEPSVAEKHGGQHRKDRALAKAYLKDPMWLFKGGCPVTKLGPVITSDGRHDFPHWYLRLDYQQRYEVLHRKLWDEAVADWEKRSGIKFDRKYIPSENVKGEVDASIRAYGRGVRACLAIYFKGENWRPYFPEK